jgi:hypothetical protein
VVISSWTGGDGTVVVAGVASVSVSSLLVTSSETDTTSAIAAMMAVTPTTHGHLGGASSSAGSRCS